VLNEHHSALLRDSGVGVVELSGQVHNDKNVPKASCSKTECMASNMTEISTETNYRPRNPGR
jgi:hypothetical protein